MGDQVVPTKVLEASPLEEETIPLVEISGGQGGSKGGRSSGGGNITGSGAESSGGMGSSGNRGSQESLPRDGGGGGRGSW